MLRLKNPISGIIRPKLTTLGGKRNVLRFINLLIFLSVGGMLSALVAGSFEVKYEKNFDQIQNLKRENFILRTARQNLVNDQMFFLVFLSQQEDFFHEYFDILEGWILGTKAEFKNIFFGYERMLETQSTIIKLSHSEVEIASNAERRIQALKKTKQQSLGFLKETIELMSTDNILETRGKASEQNQLFYKSLRQISDATENDLLDLISNNTSKLRSLRSEQEKLTWLTSNIFLVSFILQLIIFASYHTFEVSFDRRSQK